ncbi:MAG: ABC transporter permease [Gemmatimonadota bacterium]|nr:ABC transporter permease [Gemmatimonadota bacterium]
MPTSREHPSTARQPRSHRRRPADFLADLGQDLRFGARSLRRSPGFALAAIVTLALGIGANSAVFSVMNAVVLRPLPYREPGRLVSVGGGSAGEYLALRDRLHATEDLAAWVASWHPVGDGLDVARLDGAAVTVNLFRMLGVTPARGRAFTPADGELGAENVVIVSDALARRLGGDALDRYLTIEGARSRIVGVMPPAFKYPAARVEYWQPYRFNVANPGYTWAVSDKQFVGRLAPGATPASAAAELARVWPTLRKLNPLWDPGERYGHTTSVTSLQDRVLGASRAYIWMLFAAVVLVLLIASVNVANLLLARATARAPEFAVRTALGGGRGRLVRQLLTESVVLSAGGAVLGAGLGWAVHRWLVAALPPEVPRLGDITYSGTVLAYTALVSLAAGIAFGIVPALRATSSGGAGRGAAGLTRSATGVSHARVASSLVAGEVALAVMLVAASSLLLRSFATLTAVDPGFDAARTVAARVTVPAAQYGDPERLFQFYSAVLDRVRALPGVEAAAAVDKLPMAQPVWGVAVRVEGQYEDATRTLPDIPHFQSVTPGYFAAMGIRLVEGRDLTDADRENATPVAVVSEGVVRQFWPGQSAIGKRIGYPFPSEWLTVVGVVRDTKQDSLSEVTAPSFYASWRQRSRMSATEMWIVARTSGDAAALGPAIRAAAREADPAVAVGDLRTMSAVIANTLSTARFITTLVAAFGAIALLLGAVGIYGVMAYVVSERRHEMGVRLALGATRAQVMKLVVGRALAVSAVGVLAGMGALTLTSGVLSRWLYGVPAGDLLTTVLVPVVFLGVAVGASWIPALRGARGDVAAVLRSG